MTIREIAQNLIENYDVSPVPNIDIKTACEYVSWMDPDMNLPEDLTGESLMIAWNDIIEEDLCSKWDYIVSLMDDDIREAVHDKFAPCSRIEFLEEYKKQHLRKYGKEFNY